MTFFFSLVQTAYYVATTATSHRSVVFCWIYTNLKFSFFPVTAFLLQRRRKKQQHKKYTKHLNKTSFDGRVYWQSIGMRRETNCRRQSMKQTDKKRPPLTKSFFDFFVRGFLGTPLFQARQLSTFILFYKMKTTALQYTVDNFASHQVCTCAYFLFNKFRSKLN